MRIIAGPCQHETLTDSAMIAKECKRVCDKHGIDYYFKASFDKANRSSIKGIRGIGMDATLTDFEALKNEFGVNTITDVHTVEQIQYITEAYNDVVDALQIPAFLCRQTDLVKAACATDKIVNIKKGLAWTTCLVIIIPLLFLMQPTQYRNQAAMEVVAAAIAITFLAYVVQVVLWVLETSF